MHTSAEDNLM